MGTQPDYPSRESSEAPLVIAMFPRRITRFLKRVSRRLRKKFLWKTVIFNVYDRPNEWPLALVHYVTEPFFDVGSEHQYIHSTAWESVQLTRILDDLGYRVDVVDRSERSWLPDDTYELVVGNAAGNSGQRYPEYCRRTPSAHHMFYSRGPHTDVANQLVIDRYIALRKRTGVSGETMRVMDKVDTTLSMSMTDSILTIDSDGFTKSTYESTGKLVKTWFPPTSPMAKLDRESLRDRNKSNFLCFAGNGFIAKGVDLLVEAFLVMPELNLTIAGPPGDELFWQIYGARIEQSSNIKFVGFLDVGGKEYSDICKTHAWTILPSAAEGVCTSVATTMQSGLVPVVTLGTSVHVGDFGFLLPSDPDEIIESLKELCPKLSVWNDADYEERVDKTIDAAGDYSEDSYISSVTSAIKDILELESA